MRVTITGGAGFIGSHTAVSLVEAGHEIGIIDDLSNSSPGVLARIEELSGVQPAFVRADVRSRRELQEAIDDLRPEAVVHFAAKKHVGESVEIPMEYYDVNVGGLLNLIDVLDGADVRQLVFSSSGSVYGSAESLPVGESDPVRPESPYARTKAVGENILDDLCAVDGRWSVRALRYFNPAGAHPSGRLGEHPTDLLSNLLPVMMHVAVGNLAEVYVHGEDYDTPDGTGVRDYVHVMDVADAHVRALEHLGTGNGFRVYNIGRGEGTSVQQMIDATRRITGLPIPAAIGPRRPGDVAAIYNDPRRAEAELGFSCRRGLDTIVADAWRWQRNNPHGYESGPDPTPVPAPVSSLA